MECIARSVSVIAEMGILRLLDFLWKAASDSQTSRVIFIPPLDSIVPSRGTLDEVLGWLMTERLNRW